MQNYVDYLHDMRRNTYASWLDSTPHQGFSLPPRPPRTLELSGAFVDPLSLALQLTAATTRPTGRVYFEIQTRKMPHIYIYTFMQKKRNQNSKCETRRKEQKKHLACHPYNTVKAKEKKQETSPKDGIPPLYSPKSRYNTNCRPRKGNKEDKGKK